MSQPVKRNHNESLVLTGDLAGLPMELTEHLALQQSLRHYKKGQVLFYEGNRAFGMHYLNSGKVKLSMYTPDGKIYITRIATAGDLLGCHAFFTDEVYGVSAELLEDATVCFIERDQIREIQAQDPQFGFRMLSKLARELRQAEDKAAHIAYESIPERLAALLMSLRESFGQTREDGQIRLDILLSREEIASMLGTTVETTVRTLSRFKQLNLIGADKKNILIKDIGKLNSLIPV
ncbi:MAG: Crp/Fnr family transcriptional regulator [Candidatus Melainabacteria bacterium HGW-Melainabacteria-1]|nr:MAG: Crp/Fnr family transcriptional regulator [Candidatus Melainabacteria bacterium HGW-Melainabacteria-1]